jgi:fibronectin type 3 domain-containing protein
MNNLQSLRPVTRRAVSLFYKSPGICELPVPLSGSAQSAAANIAIEPVTRKAGPDSLEAIVVGVDVSLNWPEVSYIFSYVVYRATNSEGPFTLLTSNLGENSFVDTGLSPGTYYYKVTGIEPDFGETLPTPLVEVTVV